MLAQNVSNGYLVCGSSTNRGRGDLFCAGGACYKSIRSIITSRQAFSSFRERKPCVLLSCSLLHFVFGGRKTNLASFLLILSHSYFDKSRHQEGYLQFPFIKFGFVIDGLLSKCITPWATKRTRNFSSRMIKFIARSLYLLCYFCVPLSIS